MTGDTNRIIPQRKAKDIIKVARDVDGGDPPFVVAFYDAFTG